ncbi:MAG: NusG domain II-containing protein [Desulfuromonadaceae bacterium]|nr:NusG domain II-containing protein [Desulfuromonadaceae bacterium]
MSLLKHHTDMTRGDKYLLLLLLSVSFSLMFVLYGNTTIFHSKSRSTQAVVTVNGDIIRKINMPTNSRYSFAIEGSSGSFRVELDGEKIKVSEAHCAGQVCLNQGWISRAGQSIICIPEKIVIRLEGRTMLDAITQ